jgi:hypothetical protein
VIEAFWLTTLVPGYALLQVFYPEDMRRGLLATLSWSYVLSVALMAPIVALAFAVHFNVRTVGLLYFALVLFGAIAAVRFGGFRRLRRLVRSTHWFEVALVLCAVAVTVPLGGSATDDSFTHAAKIRYIRDVGFFLQDPYSPLNVIETRWHVNVHHALYAIESWVSGQEPLDLWFRSAWFFRLTGLGAVGFLAAAVFRSRWIGAVAMLGALVYLVTKKSAVYPFSITAFTVFPVLLALVIDVLERPTRSRYVRVLLCSLSLAALHVGTWFLDCLALGPAIAVWALWRRGVRDAWRRALPSVAALATGVPFLLVSALQPNYVDAQQGQEHLWMVRTIDVGSGWRFTIIDPIQYSWMLPMLAAILVLLFVAGRAFRTRLAIMAATLVTAMVFMFTPGVVDALNRVVPYWLVWRFRFVAEVIGFATVAGGLAWITRPMLRTRLARMGLALAVLCGGLAVFRQDILDYAVDRARHRLWLQNARDLQEAVRPVVPADSLVAADPQWSLVLPAVHLARVMAQDLHHANPADGGLLERYADTRELLADGTPMQRRRAIIAKHGINFILVRDAAGSAALDAFDRLGELISTERGFRVYKIRQ